jgi:hypothetical protein
MNVKRKEFKHDGKARTYHLGHEVTQRKNRKKSNPQIRQIEPIRIQKV